MDPVKIGIISDTHAQLHPAVPRVFAGVEHILHAGDIGSEDVLRELERLAPVTAISGNADRPPLSRLPSERHLDLGGAGVVLVHQGLARGRLTEELDAALRTY